MVRPMIEASCRNYITGESLYDTLGPVGDPRAYIDSVTPKTLTPLRQRLFGAVSVLHVRTPPSPRS